MKHKNTLIVIIFNMLFAASYSQVSIVIDADRTYEPVSRHLFAKFTEHLGENVYQGAWSQIVVNPEFVPLHYWPDYSENSRVMRKLKNAEAVFQLPKLAESTKKGIAAYWSPSDGMDGRLLKEDILDFQRIKTSQPAYLQTGIYLPLHRVKTYELSLKARSRKPSRVVIEILNIDGKSLGEQAMDFDEEWKTRNVELEVDSENHVNGKPYLLRLNFEANEEIELSRILLFPGDHMEGWDPEVVQLMKEAELPLLRYPGGNFVSGYHWKDGVGPLDERPVLPNPAWPIMEWNHVGNDEWITFCRLIGAEPMICVNAGNGSPVEAAEWIRYCNDPVSTTWGAMRAKNGFPEPFNVKIWEVGNELCGPWQIGFTNGPGYAKRYEDFAKAMLKADPEIQLVANGLIRVLEKSMRIDRGDNTGWNEELMQHNGDLVRSISVHSLVGGYLHEPVDAEGVWKDLVAYADNYLDYLDDLVVDPMYNAGVEPKVAITELMDWPRHPSLGNVTSISGALWYSAMINQGIRSDGLIELITHSALLNHGGGLRKDHGVVFTDPVYWANYMYSTQKGTVPLSIINDSPVFSSSGKYIIKRKDMPVVDVVALMEENEESCTVFLCNRSFHTSQKVNLKLDNFKMKNDIEYVMIQNNDISTRNSWEEPERIAPVFDQIKRKRGEIKCELPPLSLVRLVIKSEN